MSNCSPLLRAQAKAALEKRANLVAEMRSVQAAANLSDAEKRERIERLDVDVNALEAEAREAVARGEREAEVRSLTGNSALFAQTGNQRQAEDENAWRSLMPSLSEYRALIAEGTPSSGGYTVPSGTASKYIDALKANSAFLRGLPPESVVPFDSATFSVPQLVSSTGTDYVDEGETIPEGEMVWGEVKFEATKIGRIQWATVEILEDSAVNQRNAIANNLLRDASLKFDADAFTGSGSNPVKGVLSQGISTTLGTGKITVTYDDLADAVARIEAMNGTPSVVWASVDMAAALRKEKAAGSGNYQGGSPVDAPASTAWGLPILPSAFLPPKTVVVADGSRIMVGIRRNASVKVSEDARFDSDQVGFKLTMRVAGVSLAEASSAQIVKASAS
ncbi:phage major capsid protein [Streptomyces sp. NPDC090106]|uniref:phage major capsid protein n=1 Tax=Streptomyces sp. NPDC090106 TaxID=3365946 RepID=UPI003805F9F3